MRFRFERPRARACRTLLLIAIWTPVGLMAQVPVEQPQPEAIDTVVVDGARDVVSPVARADTVPPVFAASTDSVRLSAASALVRSFVLPGWGQSYVGDHGRGALYFALETGSLWMVYRTSRALAAAREQERFLHEKNELPLAQRLPLAASRAQQVEDWITLSIFWALFSGADAYVSAQLSDFVGHVGALPGPDGEVQFQVRFDVGGR